MAFSDPQTLVMGSDTFALPRTGSGDNSATFRWEDGTLVFKLSHNRGKRNRQVIRLDHSMIVPDPLITDINVLSSASVQLVVDSPLWGYDNATKKDAVHALCAWLTASSDANLIKFLGGES